MYIIYIYIYIYIKIYVNIYIRKPYICVQVHDLPQTISTFHF